VGDSQENNQVKKNGFIGHSTRAYFRLYPLVANQLRDGNRVTIKYTDLS